MKPYSIFPLQGKDQYTGAVAIEKKKEATETEKTKIWRRIRPGR
jgi:hypothetical protein